VNQSGEWQLRVEGDEGDLVFLARELERQPNRLTPDRFEDRKYVLLSSDFAACADRGDVLELGVEWLRRLSGLLRCVHGSFTPLTPGALYFVRDDGTRDIFARMVGAEFKARFGYVTAVARDAKGNPLPAPPSPTQRLAALMATDLAVAKVMRLTGSADAESWVGLSRLREVIEEDVNGADAIQKLGWASRNELDRFGHSANSVTVAGDAARHGYERTQPPAKPMTLSEAKEHIEKLRREWLKWKGVST
jgi:hypothetical protein